jgi:hypothetical protein
VTLLMLDPSPSIATMIVSPAVVLLLNGFEIALVLVVL